MLKFSKKYYLRVLCVYQKLKGNFMEVSAIGNSPVKQQKQVKRNGVLRSAAAGAGIGAVINGIQNFASQKALIKNGDAFLKNMSEEIGQIPDENIKKAAVESFHKAEQFIKAGKVDLKAVGLTALKGAVMFGAVFAGVELISNALAARKNNKQQTQAKQI